MRGGDRSAVHFIYVAQYVVKTNTGFKSPNEAVLIHGLRNEEGQKIKRVYQIAELQNGKLHDVGE